MSPLPRRDQAPDRSLLELDRSGARPARTERIAGARGQAPAARRGRSGYPGSSSCPRHLEVVAAAGRTEAEDFALAPAIRARQQVHVGESTLGPVFELAPDIGDDVEARAPPMPAAGAAQPYPQVGSRILPCHLLGQAFHDLGGQLLGPLAHAGALGLDDATTEQPRLGLIDIGHRAHLQQVFAVRQTILDAAAFGAQLQLLAGLRPHELLADLTRRKGGFESLVAARAAGDGLEPRPEQAFMNLQEPFITPTDRGSGPGFAADIRRRRAEQIQRTPYRVGAMALLPDPQQVFCARCVHRVGLRSACPSADQGASWIRQAR